jgi:hypothetical protein
MVALQAMIQNGDRRLMVMMQGAKRTRSITSAGGTEFSRAEQSSGEIPHSPPVLHEDDLSDLDPALVLLNRARLTPISDGRGPGPAPIRQCKRICVVTFSHVVSGTWSQVISRAVANGDSLVRRNLTLPTEEGGTHPGGA